jgi:hypothetical protein
MSALLNLANTLMKFVSEIVPAATAFVILENALVPFMTAVLKSTTEGVNFRSQLMILRSALAAEPSAVVKIANPRSALVRP